MPAVCAISAMEDLICGEIRCNDPLTISII
jgi:hypothetical protein